MSFVINSNSQLSMDDSTVGLTEREMKFLEKSWAKPFAEDVFPLINEEKFAVLYSSEKASRPNTPINVTVGASILKEMLGLSDDEILESLLFDVRFQYALHTTSFGEQPMSDRTLSRFREKCLRHEAETGTDLVKECVLELSSGIAKLMGMHPGVKRTDSLMVASNIRKLSRLELLYTCVANAVKRLRKDSFPVPDGMEHYCEDSDRNKTIYHARGEDVDERMKTILADAARLLKMIGGASKTEEHELLKRVVSEQAVQGGDGSLALRGKDDPAMGSNMLQNPADPDATYRSKAGKQHRGFVANVVEDVDEGKSVVSDYDFQQNTYSDSQFLKDAVETIGGQEGAITLVADGAYSGEANVALAESKNIKLVTTDMQGRKPDSLFADFEVSPDGKEALRCAGGQKPLGSSCNPKTGQCRAAFNREACEQCPFKERCKPKFHKSKTSLTFSWTTVQRAKQLRYMETDEFKELAKVRNGVESLPSVLRRKYGVDRMPVRGRMKTKLLFGFKIAAINFKKLMRCQAGLFRGPLEAGSC